jgi:hypothetical protein
VLEAIENSEDPGAGQDHCPKGRASVAVGALDRASGGKGTTVDILLPKRRPKHLLLFGMAMAVWTVDQRQAVGALSED